ncbi:hypothetical protein TWF788_010989 [Orbilia oligospora]|uniref:Uncharacterized protein n=1 Tax=Orbilia oligospora TaxID=2813651 RepID=A0A7C8KBG6_ORBOL|nr:hypothetical protein TWF788_010989 [Orbilia oligospora]
MAPPATPRNRFPSPDDVPRPRTDPRLPPRISTGTVQTSITAPAPRPQFATPGPPTTRRRQQQPTQSTIQTPGGFNNRQYSRGFSPDPDFFTSSVGQRKDGVVRAAPRVLGSNNNNNNNNSNSNSSSNKRRRRSFDLDEIDEALLVSSGKPRVLGDSSGGWKVPVEYFGGTPVPQRIRGLLHHHATPTPSLRRPTFRQGSAVISSPPGDLNLSFGDTQEDVQDDDEDEDDDDYSGRGKVVMTAAVVNGGGSVPQKKRQKSAGVFDDIESIASSLPGTRDEGTVEGVEGSNRKENSRSTITTITSHNTTTNSGLRTPQRVLKSGGISNIHGSGSIIPPPSTNLKTTTTTTAVILGEQWMSVPDQPQLKLPAKTSPTEKLNKAICAMAWSPSHRKRRNMNSKYLNGGLAATVLGWAYDAQDVVLRSNMVIEQNQKEKQSLNLNSKGRGRIGNSYAGGGGGGGDRAGIMVVKVGSVCGEEGYAAITGEEEDEGIESGAERKVILIGDENSGLRKDLRQGSWVEVRMPMWEVTVEGGKWTVGINWRLL